MFGVENEIAHQEASGCGRLAAFVVFLCLFLGRRGRVLGCENHGGNRAHIVADEMLQPTKK